MKRRVRFRRRLPRRRSSSFLPRAPPVAPKNAYKTPPGLSSRARWAARAWLVGRSSRSNRSSGSPIGWTPAASEGVKRPTLDVALEESVLGAMGRVKTFDPNYEDYYNVQIVEPIDAAARK